MSNIIRAGGGKRAVTTEAGVQGHYTNTVLSNRIAKVSSTTGKLMKWRPTKENLLEVQKSVENYCSSLRGVEPAEVKKVEADYEEKFVDDSKRAQPSRRKQYNSTEEAKVLVIPKPYAPTEETEPVAIEPVDEDESVIDLVGASETGLVNDHVSLPKHSVKPSASKNMSSDLHEEHHEDKDTEMVTGAPSLDDFSAFEALQGRTVKVPGLWFDGCLEEDKSILYTGKIMKACKGTKKRNNV